MTFYELFHTRLVQHGTSEEQASIILVEAYHNYFPTKFSLSNELGDYPDIMQTALWIVIRRAAHDWLEANKPDAWFKEIFAPWKPS